MDDEFDIEDEDIQEIFIFMLQNGYMELIGLDPFGEPLYRMTPKMGRDFPDLFDAHLSATNEVIFSLWQKGLLEMNMNNDGEWVVLPTYSTFNYKDIDVELDPEEISMLEEISRIEIEKRTNGL
jgi:hypothetical protein